MSICCYIDGSARPNPGKGGIGIAIRGEGWDYTLSEPIPKDKVTNNFAEYFALVRALSELMKNNLTRHDIQILTDSLMLADQMSGNKEVDKGGQYVELHSRAKLLARYFSSLKFTYIPREENGEANLLASKAVKGGRDGW